MACLLAASVRERVVLRQQSVEEVTPKPSPTAEAIKDLLGVAGGVYLALLMVASFLKLNLPSQIGWGGISFEPMAAIALAVSILYPFFQRLGRRQAR